MSNDCFEKHDVLYALHEMAKMNDVIQDTHGNVSMRNDEAFFIKPSGVPYQFVTIDDICKISFDISIDDDNKLNPSVDTMHHEAIYNACPWIGAICHTHSPHVVAFAALYRDISCYTTEQCDYFGDKVVCLPYADLSVWGKRATLDNTKDTRAVLLQNHGALTFASTARRAVVYARALENVARKNYLIETLANVKSIPPMLPKQRERWHTRYNDEYGQKDPDSE